MQRSDAVQVSSEYGTYKTARARCWPWLPGEGPSNLVSESFFARKRKPAVWTHGVDCRRESDSSDCRRDLARIARGQTNRLTSEVTSPRILRFSPLKRGRGPEIQKVFWPPRYPGKESHASDCRRGSYASVPSNSQTGQVSPGEKMLYSGTDPGWSTTENTLAYEDER